MHTPATTAHTIKMIIDETLNNFASISSYIFNSTTHAAIVISPADNPQAAWPTKHFPHQLPPVKYGIHANISTAAAIPKDTIALRHLSNSVNRDVSMFKAQCVVKANPAHAEKYPFPTTVNGALNVITPVPTVHQTKRNKLTRFSTFSHKPCLTNSPVCIIKHAASETTDTDSAYERYGALLTCMYDEVL